jgi:uncharacterized protein (DUF924 family)
VTGDDWSGELLNFWFSLNYDQHFRSDERLDQRIKQRFRQLWTDKRGMPVESFLGDPRTALAAVILFDQFPRNMFRGDAEQFATDQLALAIAKAAIGKGFDRRLQPDQRAFLYMPFQHSEDLDDQNRSMLLFSELGDARFIPYARKHHDIIERFGRFPHRNSILGRPPRADEIAAGDVFPW